MSTNTPPDLGRTVTPISSVVGINNLSSEDTLATTNSPPPPLSSNLKAKAISPDSSLSSSAQRSKVLVPVPVTVPVATPIIATALTIRKRDFGFLPIPKSRRHDPNLKPEEQFKFTWRMNLIFATASTVSVMNLYYIQPMLVAIANDFGVSNDTVSSIPTLAQGGYGVGILLVSPLGDLVRRRPLVLLLMFLTTTLSIGLALSRNVEMLEGLSFVVGMLTVTPQICIPWTADLAPSNRRAQSMSITLSGLIFGLVLGRVLAGIISNFASWRDTYWLAVGLQGVMTGILWFVLPDTPDKDIGLHYFQVLQSMAKYIITYPTLVQACICSCLTSAVFAGFWTSLTFLLSDAPYHYSPLDIGLLGLLGIIGALLAPQWGRLIDRIVPWTGQLIGLSIDLISMIVALAAADKSVGAVAISIVLYDMGQQLSQVSSSYRIAGIDPKARARLNGCSLLAVFIGQTSGTAIMTKIYNSSGWRPTGGCAVAFVGVALLVLLARGPHETGWIGWHGGHQLLRKEKLTDLSPEAVTEKQRVSTRTSRSRASAQVKVEEAHGNSHMSRRYQEPTVEREAGADDVELEDDYDGGQALGGEGIMDLELGLSNGRRPFEFGK